MDKENRPLHQRRIWILLGAIFLASFSLIALEITLSRLLSVLLSYHYVFVVLSFAMLGLGAGGIFVQFFRSWPSKGGDPFGVLALSTALLSMLIPFSVLFIIRAGYENTLTDHSFLYGLLLFLPFFFGGIFFAGVYRAFPSLSGMTYGLDLIGAAMGAFGAIVGLDVFGGLDVHFVLAAVASASALLLAMEGTEKRGRVAGLFGFGVCWLLMGANLLGLYQPEVPLGRNRAKEIHDALSESSFRGEIIETRWSSFGRTDLVKYEDDPGHMDIYIDGTAGSPMYRFNGRPAHPGPVVEDLKATFPGFFPFIHLKEDEKRSALVIGPGGGRDVLLALMGGIQKITAVEVNRDLVDLVRNYSSYNGGIYRDLPHVKIVIGEGRHFLKRQRERYDVILLSLPVTNTSRSLEGFALTENFLLTKDSILNYLDHLTDAGSLVVVGHNDAEILRLLSITLAALRTRGLETRDAMNRIYITGSRGAYNYLVFVLKKMAFDPGEALLRYETMDRLGFDPVSSYFPHIGEEGKLNPALVSLSKGRMTFDELEERVRERGFDISPVTDNSPFFYKIERGIPKSVSLVFGLSVILILVVSGAPLLYWKKGMIKTFLKPLLLFGLLGMAFMLIEISLMQRFVLFLGQPVLSMAILLSSLLGGAGIGSLWSSRLTGEKIDKGIANTSLMVAAMIFSYTFSLPFVFDQLLGLNLFVRLWVAVLMLMPLGFLMGFPFPLGIRTLKKSGREGYIPWMWGVNGVASVLGSVITVFVAVSLGFTATLLFSAGCYLIVFLLYWKS